MGLSIRELIILVSSLVEVLLQGPVRVQERDPVREQAPYPLPLAGTENEIRERLVVIVLKMWDLVNLFVEMVYKIQEKPALIVLKTWGLVRKFAEGILMILGAFLIPVEMEALIRGRPALTVLKI